MAPKKKDILDNADSVTPNVGSAQNEDQGGAAVTNNVAMDVDESTGLQQFLHQPRRAAVKAAQAISDAASHKKPSVSAPVTRAAGKTKAGAKKKPEPSTTGVAVPQSKNTKKAGNNKGPPPSQTTKAPGEDKTKPAKPTKASIVQAPTISQSSQDSRRSSSTISSGGSVGLKPSNSDDYDEEAEEEIPDSEEDTITVIGGSVPGNSAASNTATPSQHHTNKPQPQSKSKAKAKPNPKPGSATAQPSNSSSNVGNRTGRSMAPSMAPPTTSSSSSSTLGPATFAEFLQTTPLPRDDLASLSIDEILARPAPPDEPEYISQYTALQRLRNHNVPLVGGTSMDEKQRITEELLEARVAGKGHRYHPVALPGHGVSVMPLDPPGSGTPFDALKHEDALVEALNRKPIEKPACWSENPKPIDILGGWNQEALLKIPTRLMHRLDVEVLASLPYEVLRAQPKNIQQKLPAGCWFFDEQRREWLAQEAAAEAREGASDLDATFANLGADDIEQLLRSRVPAAQEINGLDFLALAAEVVESGTSDQVQRIIAEDMEHQTNHLNDESHALNPTAVAEQPATFDNMTRKRKPRIDWTHMFNARGDAVTNESLRTYAYYSSFEQEENFLTRPSIRLAVPDNLKSILVDDWENVTKSLLLVPLPSQAPANYILDDYFNEEKLNRRLGSPDADILEEFVTGLKTYFDKAVGKILLYRFERNQLQDVSHTAPLPPYHLSDTDSLLSRSASSGSLANTRIGRAKVLAIAMVLSILLA